MKVTSLPRYTRNAKRFEQIVRILAKYGLADWIESGDREFIRKLLVRREGEALTRAERIRLALTELGTTFIKLGQMLSTRADLVGPDLAAELTKLQADTPPDSPATVRAMIEGELGRPLEDLFAEFDDSPVGSASIAQVHQATLPDGSPVVVKVQHDGIEEKIRNDLDILTALAGFAEQHSADIALYQPSATLKVFRRNLMAELDFSREEQNMERFRANFSSDANVHMPRPIPERSAHRVLTMERVEGISVADSERMEAAGVDLREFARRGCNLYLDMIFRDRFYHADPHPGNILVLPGDVIGLLDFGMVGTLDDQTRDSFEGLIQGFLLEDGGLLTEFAIMLGDPPADLDRDRLEADLAEFVSTHLTGSLKRMEISRVLARFTDLVRRHRIVQKPGISMLVKVLIMLEGTGRKLDPDFNLAGLLEPYYRRLAQRRLSPANILRRLQRTYRDWDRLVQALPRDLGDIIRRVRKGTLDVHLDHRRLDAVVNRVAHGMVTAAILVGSALILASDVPPTIAGVSVLGVLGTLAGLALAATLLRAIRKSGGLAPRSRK
jgi:ubiquinone biosynthesis protein